MEEKIPVRDQQTSQANHRTELGDKENLYDDTKINSFIYQEWLRSLQYNCFKKGNISWKKKK